MEQRYADRIAAASRELAEAIGRPGIICGVDKRSLPTHEAIREMLGLLDETLFAGFFGRSV